MALETRPPTPADEDIVDAEEVGRLDQIRARTKARLAHQQLRTREAAARQRVNVARRLSAWFSTADVTDADLAREIERKRRAVTARAQAELQARVRGLQARLRVADEHQAAALTLQLTAAQTQLQLRQDDDADRLTVAGHDLGRARWMKKAGRYGMVGAGTLAYLNGVAVEPLLALAALGAVPVGWLYLGREFPAAGGAAPGPEGAPVSLLKDGAVTEATGTHENSAAVFVPDTLSALGRVSLVKRENARVQGEVDLVTALVKAGIITEAQRDQTHLSGVIQPSGPGWIATVELPRGMPASAAVGKVEELASAMRIKRSQIEIRPDTSADGHDGRLVLWVADQPDPFGTGITVSELVHAQCWDFWKQGVPLGPDARARRHMLHLIWSSILLGGLMGYGKSYLARLIAAAAALDPTMRIIVITGKTGPDWAPLKYVAHQWIAGASPDVIRKVLSVMETTITEMQDRGTELERLYETDPAQVPEGKVTPALAANGMGPVLLVVDELQELLDGAALVQVAIDDDLGEEGGRAKKKNARDILVDSFARYVRVTRFVLGMGVFITQRPSSDSVPTKLRDVCAKRGSFRVKSRDSAKMVLGDDAVNQGAAPHLLGENAKGIVVLELGDEAGHITVKADVIDLPAFKDICLRGRQLRLDAGTLTGDALEYGKQDLEKATRIRLLTDCVTLLEDERLDRARAERLVEILQRHLRDRYAGLTAADLQARLRDAGAGGTTRIGAVDGLQNARGYTRDQLATALDEQRKNP